MTNQDAIQILEIMLKKADIFEEEALTHAIEHMKRWQWVSCDIQMPKTGNHVLVDGGVAYYCGHEEWRSASNNYIIEWDVTHWMPLPDAPEVQL